MAHPPPKQLGVPPSAGGVSRPLQSAGGGGGSAAAGAGGARLEQQLLKERLYRSHGKNFAAAGATGALQAAGLGGVAGAGSRAATAASAYGVRTGRPGVASAAALGATGAAAAGPAGAGGAGELVANKRAKRAQQLEQEAAENLARASEVAVPKSLQPLLGASMPLRHVKLVDDPRSAVPIGRYDTDVKVEQQLLLQQPLGATAGPSSGAAGGSGAAAATTLSKSRLPATPAARRALLALSHKHSSGAGAGAAAASVTIVPATGAAAAAALGATLAGLEGKQQHSPEQKREQQQQQQPQQQRAAATKAQPQVAGAPAGGRPANVKQLEYEQYLLSPFSFIDKVIEQPYTEEFVYLVPRGPYDLQIVKHDRIDPNNYYTMSRAGVTHFYQTETDFTSLDQWEREYFLYTKMMGIKFFMQFRKWKAFYFWKKYVRRTRLNKCIAFLQANLYILNPVLQKSILQLRALCYKASQWTLFKIDPRQATLTLTAFCSAQQQQKLLVIKLREALTKEVRDIVRRACDTDKQMFLINNKFRTPSGAAASTSAGPIDNKRDADSPLKRNRLLEAKLAGTRGLTGTIGAGAGDEYDGNGAGGDDEYNNKVSHAEKAAIRSKSRQLTKFIRLADYFVIDTLITLCMDRTSDVLKFVRREPGAGRPEGWRKVEKETPERAARWQRLAQKVTAVAAAAITVPSASDDEVKTRPGGGASAAAAAGAGAAAAAAGTTAASSSALAAMRGFGVAKEDRNVEKPLFSVELQLETETISFTPQLKVFQETLREFIIHAVKKVMSYDRLIADPEPAFQVYTNVAQDDGDDDQSAELKLDAYVLEDDAFLETIEGIKDGLAVAFQQAVVYVRDFDRYLRVYLENSATDISALASANISTLQVRLKTFHTQNADFEKMKTVADIGIIQVDSTRLKELFLPSPKRCIHEMERLLPELFRDRVKSLSDEIQYHKDNLSQLPNSVPEFANILTLLAQAQDNLSIYAERHLFVQQLHDLMTVEHSIKVAEEDKQKFDELEKLRANFGILVQKTDQEVPTNTERFSKELNDHIPQLEAKVSALATELKDESIYNPESEAKEVLEYLETRALKIMKLEEQVEKWREYQDKFGMDKTHFAELKTVKEDLELKLKLWQAYKSWDELTFQWMAMPFARIDTVDIGAKVADYMRTCNKAKKLVPDVAGVLRRNIVNIQDTLPVVTDLRSPHLLNRHWDDITALLQHDIKGDEHATLGTLITHKAMEHQAAIKAIAIRASNEAVLQALLSKVENTWEETKLPVSLHNKTAKDVGAAGGNKDTYILGILDDVIERLDESNVTINTILGSRFVDALKKEVTDWAARLKLFEDTLNEWTTCQRKWLYLETIFSEKDMVKQLPEEAQLFMKVDVQWKDIMRRTAEAPNAMKACIQGPGSTTTSVNMLAMFRSFNKDLEEVRKQMEKFLETRRAMFPRFYFMSDEELIYILSKSKTPAAIQKALEKCFENIFALDFKSENRDVKGMFSAEGEKVVFGLPTKTHRAIESWLGDLEKNMWSSLKAAMRTGYQQNTQSDAKLNVSRADFIKDSLAQVVMTIAQILWCIGTQRALQSERPREALSRWYTTQVAQLAELTAMVRGSLRDADRKKIVALITTDVHARDVIQSLIKDQVASVSHFSWQQQLRFYWEKDSSNVQVRQANAEFLYGYEYIGIASRLVITPLTDRCWMTVTGALHLRFGASPAGPAGTGKTESVKDLAKALGFFCIVFNCSDTIQYQGMARHFSGLAQTGAWTCLDEFNRIDVEVLSVVAQQLLSIRQALLQNVTRFNFEHQEILLKSTFGVMITMNPDYAGRTELPDNLKVLFRPVAMMIPDYAMIAEIMLYAEGFDRASELSKKMVKLYKLSSEQLSQQDHYDFGMRAVKSVLVMAGALKREDQALSEDKVLIRAMRDSNLPKFLSQDLPLFHAIVSDLFPTVKVPDRNHGELEVAIQNVLSTQGLQQVPSFVTKVVQLHDTFNVRFGVMLVGPTGAGKSTCYNTLARAMTLLRQNDSKNPAFQLVHINVINPKCITREELYGEVNELTQVWSDGLASSILRNAMLDKSNDRHWVVFDGPIDAMWIENMNSVLDDNMTLCLVNGERIKLKRELRMLFEVQDLAAASPATVSRCGMVYMSPSDLGWMPYVQSWLPRFCKKLDPKLQNYLLELFKVKVTAGLAFIRDHIKGKEPIPTVDISLVTGLCAIFSSLFTEANGVNYEDTFEVQKQAVETVFAFAFAWGIGGALDGSSQAQFAKYMSELFLFVRVPGSLFDYFVDVRDPGGSFRQWESKVPAFVYDAKQPYFQIQVPTIDTVRYGSLLELLLDVDKPVFFTGYTGVGKSVVAIETFQRLQRGSAAAAAAAAANAGGAAPAAGAAGGANAAAAAGATDTKTAPGASAGAAAAAAATAPVTADSLLQKEKTYLPMTLTFSAQTDAKKTQLTIESKLFRLSARLLGPPTPDKRVVIFVDDVNMPALEDFDGSAQAQPPVELLRQFLDYKMFYDRKTFTEKKIHHTTLMCCAAPPGGGRNELTPRFVRHFNMLCLPNPPDAIMRKIFGSILSGFFSGTDFKQQQLPKLSDMIVAATIELYNNLSTELPPVPEKAHYIFNLRDISKVFQGILMIRPAAVPNHDTLVRLWIHELMRCFHDRLVSVEDKRWFTEKVVQLLSKHFGLPWAHDDLFERRMIMFGDWFRADAMERMYEENLQPAKVADVLDEYLDDYNRVSPSKMSLVFFDDAIIHISRIARILRQPRGNAMLVGVGGSGKQSLTRLACFMSEYVWMPIELTRGYTYGDFQEHLKRCFITTGVEGKSVVFPVVDNQIIDERFLEDINNILNSGEVPNLFPPDELHKVIEDLTPKVRELKLAPDTSTATVLAVFQQRVRDHLHVVLCMSPVGDSFRTRCRKFPSLISCTTIDWYTKWSPQALLSVATRVLSTVPDVPADMQKALADACVDIHEAMDDKCELFYNVLRRRVYTTPKSYLDMLACFVAMLTDRRNELRAQQNRLLTGIAKIADTKTVVAELKEMLTKLQPTLVEKRKATEQLIAQLDVDTRAADKVRLVVERETKLVNQQTDAQRELQVEAAADLEKTRPLLESAEKAVASLDRTQLAELRIMKQPPPLVSLALESVCLFFGEAPTFDNAKRICANPSFVTQLKNIIAQKDKVDAKVIVKLKKFLQNEDFKEENITPVFRPAGALCAWVHAMYRYSEVWKVVAPKQQRLIDMTEALRKQQAELKKKEDELKAVEANVNALKAKCDEAIADRTRLEKKMADTELKLVRAETLTGALGNEHIRWRADADKKAVDLSFVVGDVFVASACVSYYGGFTGEYRAALVAQWLELTRDKKIPVTEDWSLQTVLATPRDIQQWTSVNHLPTDDVSIDSAIIVKHAPRWPLMIDPQGQAKKWIKNEYRMAKDEIVEDLKNPNLISVRQNDENLMRYLDRAVRNGKVVLMEDIGEEVDGALDPILLKQTYKPAGGGGLVLRLGDNEVPYDENFRFFMTTNLANPHYLPEICIKVTLLNFTVTRKGLEDQLLSDVVKIERAEIEAQRQKYIISIANEQKTLYDIETKMLHLLSTSSGKVLDDETLSGTLADSKERYNSITQRVKSAQEITAQLNVTRDQYRIAAARGSILYFVIADLALIDPMYQYSLPYFVNLFKMCIKKAKDARDLKERLENILQTTTDTIFANVSRGLFEQHKLTFSFLICTQILRLERKEITDTEWGLLLRAARPPLASAAAGGGALPGAGAAGAAAERKVDAFGQPIEVKRVDPNPNPNKSLITEDGWNLVLALDAQIPAFKDLAKDVRDHLPQWKQYIESVSVEKEDPPGTWGLSSFQKLLLLKAFRPEKLMLAIHAFVNVKMGALYVDSQTTKLDDVFRDSDFKTPIIFVLSTGADPANLLFNFATERGYSERLHVISLGKGQGENATRLINAAKEKGDWVLLQNCHLAKSWMSELERHVEQLHNDFAANNLGAAGSAAARDEKDDEPRDRERDGPVDRDFRLWLTSMPSDSFPISVLQVGIKLTNEPPKGLKANLIRSYTTVIKPAEFERTKKPKPWRKLVFGLCFFHAVIQERKKFGSLGWNKSYEFNDSDLEAAMQVLRNFLDGNDAIPWDALRYVCGQINYGGRVTDDFDRRCLMSILSKFYTPEIVNDDAYRFLGIQSYFAPKDGDMKSYVRYIELLPAMADPQIFGMHENANITFQRSESDAIVRTILSIQPREVGSAAGRPTKQIVQAVAREIEERLPPLLDRKKAEQYIIPQADKGGLIDSLGTVLVQEAERFNRLLARMKKSLEELRLANDGKLAMSAELDAMYLSLLNNEVPDLWARVAYPSLKALGAWVKDLHQRIAFLSQWVSHGPPKCFWLSGFFFTQGFMTGVLQSHARKVKKPIDTLNFQFRVLDVRDAKEVLKAPDDGVYVYGLFMDGARWDAKTQTIADSRLGEVFSPVPMIHFIPTENYVPSPNDYACPVYKTSNRAGVLSTTGQSTNFVLAVNLPTIEKPDHWVLRGAALLCQLDN